MGTPSRFVPQGIRSLEGDFVRPRSGSAESLGALSVIFLLDLLVSPAAFSTVTVTRARILRLSFTIRNVFRVSLILSVTLPVAGTVKDFFASVTFFLRF